MLAPQALSPRQAAQLQLLARAQLQQLQQLQQLHWQQPAPAPASPPAPAYGPCLVLAAQQQHINNLLGAQREEAQQLMQELLKAQKDWHDELVACGVLVGLPALQPQPTTPPTRRGLTWQACEREALTRQLGELGVGKWPEVGRLLIMRTPSAASLLSLHAALCDALRGFPHGVGDVEDATWQCLAELQLLLSAPQDRAFLGRLLMPLADRAPCCTPGPAFEQLAASPGALARQLRLLADFNALVGALLRSEAVAGYFRALCCATSGTGPPPAPWWDVEADVGLLVGLWRHGVSAFDAVRRDPNLAPAFQGYHRACCGPSKQQHQEQHQEQEQEQEQLRSQEWPPEAALASRARVLCGLLAKAVALADTGGLLMPLRGESAAADRLAAVSSGQPGAAAFARELWPAPADALDEAQPLAELAASSATDSDATATASEDYAAILPTSRGRGRGRSRGRGRGRSSVARGRGRSRGVARGRGRGPAGRRSAADLLFEEAAEFIGIALHPEPPPRQQQTPRLPQRPPAGAAGATHDCGAATAASRRDSPEVAVPRKARTHQPKPRADVQLALLQAGLSPATAQPEADHPAADDDARAAAAVGKQGQPNKGQPAELLAVLLTWGAPEVDAPPAAAPETAAAGPAAATAAAAGAAAASARRPARDAAYKWAQYAGRVDFSPQLQACTPTQLTAMLKRLLSEMQGLLRAKQVHTPNCACTVCKQRRKLQAKLAAAGAAGSTQQPPPAPAKAHVLTPATAARLRERLELLRCFRATLLQLRRGWHVKAFARGPAGDSDMPDWWQAPDHDYALLQGVVQHGFGNWAAIAEDPSLLFNKFAAAAGIAGTQPAASNGAGGSGAQEPPGWMPSAALLDKRACGLLKDVKKALGLPGPRNRQRPVDGKQRPKATHQQQQVQQQQQQQQAPDRPQTLIMLSQLVQSYGHSRQLMNVLRVAAAAGSPELLAEYMQQQQQQTLGQPRAQPAQPQQQAQQQQQAPQSVLGKRSSSAAGLEDAAGSPQPQQRQQPQAQRQSHTLSPMAPAPDAPAAPAAAGTVVRHLPVVQRDAAGRPCMPLVLSPELSIIALGRVVSTKPAFHNATTIFPVGYTATFLFPSTVDRGAATRYTTIIAEQINTPLALFVVVAADAPGKQWLDSTPQGVWQQVCSQAAAAQGPDAVLPSVDGVTQMGLSHPVVATLIQELTGARQCALFRPELSVAPPALAAAIRQQTQPPQTTQQSLLTQALPSLPILPGLCMPSAMSPASAMPAAPPSVLGMRPPTLAMAALTPQQQAVLMSHLLQRQQQEVRQQLRP